MDSSSSVMMGETIRSVQDVLQLTEQQNQLNYKEFELKTSFHSACLQYETMVTNI